MLVPVDCLSITPKNTEIPTQCGVVLFLQIIDKGSRAEMDPKGSINLLGQIGNEKMAALSK